jgi:hypothetical protein
MLNYSPPVLDRRTWGIHINSGRFITSPPNHPEWLNPFQKQEWQNRGVVVWNATNHVVTHLYARYALKLLDHMQETDLWKTSYVIVGSPVYQIPIPNPRRKKQPEVTESELPKEGWVLTNKIELTSDQAGELLAFLTAEKETLKHIATNEDRDARETLGKVYSLIAEYGREIRERRKEVGTIIEPRKKKIIPTTLQKGKYFTVSQAAEACNKTSRQIRAWIRRGELKAIELPGLGMIIEVGKLNQFVSEKGFLI